MEEDNIFAENGLGEGDGDKRRGVEVGGDGVVFGVIGPAGERDFVAELSKFVVVGEDSFEVEFAADTVDFVEEFNAEGEGFSGPGEE